MKRNRRAGVEDRWYKTIRDEQRNEKKVPSARHGKGKRWMARYVDDEGHERAKAFDRKADAQMWLDNDVTAKLATGTYVTPKAGLITVGEIHKQWSQSQGHISPSTARTRDSAWRTHVQPRWGNVSVVDVKTSAVKAWVTQMIADKVGVPMIVLAFGILRQVLGAAVEDHRIPRNPCTGVKLPKAGRAPRPRVPEPHPGEGAGRRRDIRLRGHPVPGLHRAAVGRDGRAARAGLRHAAPPSQRQPIGF
jgi:hypothetical protein